MKSIRDFEYWEFVADHVLPDSFVEWESITPKIVKELSRLLDEQRSERALQTFLGCNPTIMAQLIRGGSSRWVIPQKRLGDKHITDFVIGEFNSLGYHWYGIELESPTAKLFTKAGDPTKELTHALRQIHDWRSWLNQNIDYARRDRDAGGLELREIRADLPAMIFIGRRSMLTPDTQQRRKQMSHESSIEIHTYDHLLETAHSWCEHSNVKTGNA